MKEVKTIAVIGLGLIGGSILKGLKGKGYRLLGVARRQKTIEQAIKEKIIDEGSTSTDIVNEADLIFICTPISKTIETVELLSTKIKTDAIVTDVASLKKDIVGFVDQNYTQIRFIGGHPMAGTENKGLDAAFENFFKGAKWVLTPSVKSSHEDLNALKNVIEKLEAKVVIAKPDKHDEAVALISHMPLFLSQALFGMVGNYPDKEIAELALKLAASGFRDTTRLAATNPELSKDMLILNKENIVESIDELRKYLDYLEKELLENEENFIKISENLAEKRRQMYSSDGKNTLV